MKPVHNRCVEQDLRELAKLIGGNQAQIAIALAHNGFSIDKFHALRNAVKKAVGYDGTTFISMRSIARRLHAEDEANDVTTITAVDTLEELVDTFTTRPLTSWQRNQINRWEAQRLENQTHPVLLNPPISEDDSEIETLRDDNERMRAEIRVLQDRLRRQQAVCDEVRARLLNALD